jgi:integrase
MLPEKKNPYPKVVEFPRQGGGGLSAPSASVPVATSSNSLLDVREAASALGVSETWVRRHLRELPVMKVGRLLRFDPQLLHKQFQGRTMPGNRLKPERIIPMGFKRYQRGSVYKSGKRGRQVWVGMWREDVPNANGGFTRRQRKVKLGSLAEMPNRTQALEQLAVLMRQKPITRLSFAKLVEKWKATVVPTLKDSTAANYRYNLERYLVPAFGNREIASLNRFDVETFLVERSKSYSRNTLRGMRAALRGVLSWAVDHEWIPKNVCSGVKLPRAGKNAERPKITAEWVALLVAHLPEPIATLILFVAVTGVRIGEAVGIKLSDFEGDVLHIQRRIYERREGTPKTKSSDRYIPIPAPLLARLRTLGEGEWIFRTSVGTPLDPKNAMNRYVRPTATALGLKLGGWHSFRHAFSTQLLKKYPVKVVSEILGHGDIETTLAIYQHPGVEDRRGPLNEMAAHLLPDVTKLKISAA